MSAVINTKEKNLGMDFLKRAAGHISGAVGSYISEAMPTTSSTLKEAKDTAVEVHSTFVNTAQSIVPKVRDLKRQIGFRNISDWFNQKEDEFDVNGFNDAEMDFDIPVDDPGTEAQLSELAQTGNQISEAVIKSTHKSVEAQIQATANVTASVNNLSSVVVSGFDQTNKLLSKLIEITTKNTSTLIEATVAANTRDSDPNQDILGSGKFNLKDYKKIVSTNIKNSELGMAATMLPMLLNPEMLKSTLTPQELIKMGLSAGINKASPNFKRNLKALDDAINDTIVDSLIRIGQDRYSFGPRGLIGKLFGLDPTRRDTDTARSKLELKSVPYDTISKEAITNAIPGYLQKILVALGGPDMVYDYRSRSFRTRAAIKRDFQNASADRSTIYGATRHVQNVVGTSDFSRMTYDLLLNNLSTNMGTSRRVLDQLNTDTGYAEDYIRNILYGGKLTSEQDINAAKAFAQRLSKLDPAKLHDITNQVAKNNVNRSKRMSQYAKTADQYNIDLSGFTDSATDLVDVIKESYGRRDLVGQSDGGTSTINTGKPSLYATRGLSGINYTNVALYEIFRKLNDGINVYQTGSDHSRKKKYPKWKNVLSRPKDYRPKPEESGGDDEGGGASLSGPRGNWTSDEPNLLRNNTSEDGTTEELSRGQRFTRWGKKRGGDLMHAIFSGDSEQVRAAFSGIVGDVGQVAGDGVKKGVAQINESFGNVSGYLKHKLFGTEYTYTDKGENGEKVTKVVEKNDGIFGFLQKKISSGFDEAAKRGSKWLQSVTGYFNYGDKDDSSDVKAKRKKFITTSVGALAGAGILGGPLGLIMGAVAGNALSASGIGTKLKSMLFGRKDGKATGLLTRIGDGIVDPIRYQIGKSVNHVGNILKKNILGPLSDIGAAIHDRITSAASNTFGKVFGTIGNIILAPFKGIGKALLATAKAPITLAGALFRGVTGIQTGVAGGAMNAAASIIAGGSTHKIRHEDGTVEEISTREWLRQRRKARADEVKQNKYSDYKTWKANVEARRAQNMTDLGDAMAESEHVQTPEEAAAAAAKLSEDTDAIRTAASQQAEDTAEIREDLGKMADEALTKGSLYVHDEGIHSRMDRIIELLGGSTTENNAEIGSGIQDDSDQNPISEIRDYNTDSSNSDSQRLIPTGMKSEKEKSKEDNANYGAALFSSGATLSDEGGIDDRDVNGLERMARGIDGTESKSTMFQRFRDLLKRNQDKADAQANEDEEEKESFLSKLLKGLVTKGWPLILGGLTLFSDKFRDLLFGENGLLSKAGSWLLENLPTIIKNAWNGIKDAAEDANREIENQATGATTVVDPVTGEEKSVMSAEGHAADIQNGIFSTAVNTTMNLPRLLKDAAVIAGERTILRGGAGLVSAGGGLANIGGNFINAGAKGIQTVTNGVKSFMGNTIFKGTTRGLQLTSSAANATITGSSAARNVAAGGATVKGAAGGFKSMMGKITDVKTWINPRAVGNIVGGIASDISAGIGWEAAEIGKNKNIVGDYGLGNAGGFVRTSTTAKTVTTTTIGVAGGIAIGQAVATASAAIVAAGGLAAVGSANFWNPVGWCALITAGVLAAAAGLSALANAVIGFVTDGADKDYAIRSNASKLNAVIKNNVTYTNGKDNPMYVYCGQESDRVLGLTKGLNVKDPDLMFGRYLKKIADGLASSPGTEVLLYDLIHNMAVQGVPFAVLMAGDSEEASCGGDNANKNTTGEPPADRTGPFGGKYCTVKKSTVRKHTEEIFADIAANIGRQDKSVIFTEDNLEFVYDAGKDVVRKLKNEGILDDNGKVQTKNFKGSPGSGKNDSGWTALDKICRKKGAYFLTKCLVYINSKIEANKNGQQWLEERQEDVVKLLDGLKDHFKKEAEEQVEAMRAQGMSDKEIEEALKTASDPKGAQANGAADLAPSDPPESFNITSSGIRSKDKADVTKEIKYLSAAYAYSHPDLLQSWVQKNQSKSGVNVDFVNSISKWDSFTTDNRKKATLRSQMLNASLQYGEEAGDIFNLIPQFDWSDKGEMLKDGTKSPGEKYGSAFVIRGEKKKSGEGILDKFFEGTNPSEKTPKDVHEMVFGKKNHGVASEATSTKDQDWTVGGSGVIARIADFIDDYGSAQGLNLTSGPSNDKWRNVLLNLPANAPRNLPVGGPVDEGDTAPTTGVQDESQPGIVSKIASMISNAMSPGDGEGNTAAVSEGGNPLNKPFNITRGGGEYGWRVLDKGKEFHGGIDMYPTDGSGEAEVGARFNGTIKKVENNVSYSGLNTPQGYGAGNYVTYVTDSGLTIKNFHLKRGSIPSNIKPGARVKVGDKLGDMGTTGRSTGPHLHYQMESPGSVDPEGNHTFDPTSSVNGGETMSSFNDYGYNYNPGDVSFMQTEDTSNKSGFQAVIELLKNAGLKFLNAITGGMFGNTETPMNSALSSVSYGSSGTYLGNISENTITNVDDFLKLVAKEIGTKENPANSNHIKYNNWFYGQDVSGSKYLWCMAFVQWCYNEAGLPIEHKTASCSNLLEYYQKNHPELVFDAKKTTPKPGDVAIFHNGTRISHTGIVERATGTKNVTTIEGNTSGTNDGSQDNGGCVARKYRSCEISSCYLINYIRVVDWEKLKKEAELAAAAMNNVGEGAEAMFRYLKTLGYSDEAAAAVVGCWEHESSNRPKRVESDYLPDFQNTFNGNYDEVANNIPKFNQYSSRVAKGRSGYIDKRDGKNYAGLGYAQWTGGRSKNLLDFARKNNARWYEAGTQLAFMNEELHGGWKGTYEKLMQPQDIDSATRTFALGYEHGGMSASSLAARQKTARAIYSKLKGKYNSMISATGITELNAGGPKTQKPANGQPLGGPSSSKIGNQNMEIDYDAISTNMGKGGPAEGQDTTGSELTPVNFTKTAPTTTNRKITTSSVTPAQPKTPKLESFFELPKPVTTEYPSYPGTGSGSDEIDAVITLLHEVISHLAAISGNTGTSNSLLEAITEKDFVDQGLRNSLSKLKDIPRKGSYARHGGQMSSGNKRAITAMARP